MSIYSDLTVIIGLVMWSVVLVVLTYMGMHKSLSALDRQIKDVRSEVKRWRDYMRDEVRRLDKDQSLLVLEMSKQRWERTQKR